MKNKIYFAVLWVGCITCPIFAAGAAEMLAIAAHNQEETITLNVPSIHSHKVFTVPDPDRLVIDVPSISGHMRVSLPSSYKGALIKDVRFGQFTRQTSRFVFDLKRSIRVESIDERDGENPALIIHLVDAQSQEAAQQRNEREVPPVPPKAREEQPRATRPPEAIAPHEEETAPPHPGGSIASREEDIHAAIPEAVQKSPEKETKIAREEEPETPHYVEPKPETGRQQLVQKVHKTGKPVIVIDPGHGGQDPGTIGSHHTEEKDITLQYAKALKAKLSKSGRYHVMLTREDDTFIMLRERVAIARRAGASLFISLHADSAPDKVRGLSVYTESEDASDTETEALAARENKADVLENVDLSAERDDVAGILISLASRDTMNRSAMLADLVVTSLDGKIRLLPNSHRFAGFAVLKAPDIPSILIETGFLSHPQEEKMLNSKAYRDKVTSCIANAVDRYFRQVKQSGDL